jgi:hexokinase
MQGDDMTRQEKLQEIKEHPERHRHTFEELTSCCMHGDALDLQLMEAHAKYAPLGTNGGRRCDVSRGPCACGAWH